MVLLDKLVELRNKSYHVIVTKTTISVEGREMVDLEDDDDWEEVEDSPDYTEYTFDKLIREIRGAIVKYIEIMDTKAKLKTWDGVIKD